MVAWTCLFCPQPEELAKEVRTALRDMKRPNILGIDEHMGDLFFKQVNITLQYEYDPAKHFR